MMETFIKAVRRKYLRLIKRIIFTLVPINRKKVVFDHFNGLDVGCNPGYIARKLYDNYPDTKIVWLLSDKNVGQHETWISYARTSFLAKCIALASARVVVINTVNTMKGWPKKKGQVWIQTGHGSFGIKKIGVEVDPERRPFLEKEARRTNLFLSNSRFESDVFQNGFLYRPDQIIECGHARNDIFFDKELTDKVGHRVRNKYDLRDRKLLLFAPTHGPSEISYLEELDIDGVLTALTQTFGGQWVLGLRLHPRTRNRILRESIQLPKFNDDQIADLSGHSDMQELLVTADAMVTDYSSGIFDFFLSKRPSFFHLSRDTRESLSGSLYFDFEATPAPTSHNSAELVQNITAFDRGRYEREVDIFLTAAGSIESGNGAQRAAELIHQLTEGARMKDIRSPNRLNTATPGTEPTQ